MLGTFLLGVVYMAILSVLAAPDSKWATIITDVTDAMSSLTQAAIKGSVS